MPRDPQIVTPRTAPPPHVVLRPIAAGLGALILAGCWLALLGAPRGGSLLGLIHLALVAGLLTLATAAAAQLSAATTGQSHPHPHRLGLLLLTLPAGGLLLCIGFLVSWPPALAAGGLLAFTALAWVFAHALGRIARGRRLRPLHLGLLLGLLGFLGAATGGILMAVGLAFDLPVLLAILPWHLALAFGLGFGALLAGVSWQLLPMFGRARQLSGPIAFLPPALFAGAAIMAALLSEKSATAAAWPLAAAALCHAMLGVWALARGTRGKPPPYTGLAHLAAALLLLASTLVLTQGLFADALLLAFGGLAVAVLGYLERILPFLVFERHLVRLSPGKRIPKLQEILPPRGRLWLLALYLTSLSLAAFGVAFALRLFGVALAALAIRLLLSLRRMPARDATER